MMPHSDTYIVEELVLVKHREVEADWQTDYNKMIAPFVADDQPCYMIYR